MNTYLRYNFCTLFDFKYLTRGIALYESLEKVCNKFWLYIYSFDEKTFEVLQKLNLKYATIISKSEFETEELKNVKKTRTLTEYFWTCSSQIIFFTIKNFDLDHCVYLDADVAFYSSPEAIFKEIGDYSVAISPHNFSPNYKTLEIYGKYCVQFVFFKNDKYGLDALNWWRKSCLKWCYSRLEDEKYGDQKYLDKMFNKFKKVIEIKHLGAGIAPWNIDNYYFRKVGDNIFIKQKNNQNEKWYELIFYHFQGLKFYNKNNEIIIYPSNLKINKFILDEIYRDYVLKLIELEKLVLNNNLFNKELIFKRNFFYHLIFIKDIFRREKIVQLYHAIKNFK